VIRWSGQLDGFQPEEVIVSKVLIIKSMNTTPEEEIAEQIAPLVEEGYRVTSAQTTIYPFGEMDTGGFQRVARHVYYVATIVLDKPTPMPTRCLPG
jgi:hypothetical protein